MLLDYMGDAPLREGYIMAGSEVEFLRLSVSGVDIQVQGKSLCNWAQSFCEGRSINARKLDSPLLEIQDLCAGLEGEQAGQIFELLGQIKFDSLARPITVSAVLTALYPTQLWSEDPSYPHAADWLLWLFEVKPQKFLKPLFEAQCEEWRLKAYGLDKNVYSATDEESASDAIQRWVGVIRDVSYQSIINFPRQIPDQIQNDARKQWKRLMVETRGNVLREYLSATLHEQLKAILVEEAFRHFNKHKEDLSQELYDVLSPLLGWQEQKELQSLLPPAKIYPMPKTPNEVLEWFSKSYFPYRRWQYGSEDKHIQADVNRLARDFGLWYLERYPEAISGGSMKDTLSFSKIVEVTKNSKHYVTLILVLDGLHVGDAQTLHVKIRQKILRLSTVENSLVFTPLPTVTEFCKPALFTGVPPHMSDAVSSIGEIIPEKGDPLSRLSEAALGDVFLWRIQQPDSAYHEKGREALVLRKVEGELEKIVKDISGIVERVPARLPLQLIITTDHGRILASSPRKVQHPKGMNSHGRAAWGEVDIEFGNNELLVVEDLAYLKGERYGMKCNFAVLLNEDAFLMSDGKSGKEHFPHGGVYPEEVIIPWITYIRDYVAPEVKVKITGRGIAGSSGKMKVEITNYADIEIALTKLLVLFDGRKIDYNELNFVAGAGSTVEYNLEIQKWPTIFEIKHSKFEAEILQPNGLVSNAIVDVALESDEMYHSDSILEDMV